MMIIQDCQNISLSTWLKTHNHRLERTRNTLNKRPDSNPDLLNLLDEVLAFDENATLSPFQSMLVQALLIEMEQYFINSVIALGLVDMQSSQPILELK